MLQPSAQKGSHQDKSALAQESCNINSLESTLIHQMP